MTENRATSETKLKQLEYWDGLQSVLNELNGSVSGNRKPQPQHSLSYPIGRSEFHLSAVMHIRERYVRVELYISGEEASDRRARLEEEKDKIEQELGFKLEWGDQSPEARDQRVSHYLYDIDPLDKTDWDNQHNWIASNLNAMHQVFIDRVKTL